MLRVVAAASAGLLLAPLTSAPAPPAAYAADPVRILVVGDSITQGSAGDWTWRYRLGQHLSDAGVAFDLVGQRDDLYDNVAGVWGSHDYVDPAFDQDHAARWGMRLFAMDVSITDLVTTFHPDVVLELLGDNDLSDGRTPAEVKSRLGQLVSDARAADPGVDVVLGQDPRPHTQPQAPALNALITELAGELDTPAARVVVAETAAGYDDLSDTWDGAHPNARGELKIAAAFEDALHELDDDWPAADPVPTVPLGPRIPPVLAGTGLLGSVRLDWVRSPGAQQSEVWARDITSGEAWHRVAEGVTGTTYTAVGLPAGHLVQAFTKPWKGFWVAEPDAWSNVVQVQVPGDRSETVGAVPPLPAVGGAHVRVTRHGRLKATAARVAGATSYTLRAAGGASCARMPGARRFDIVASGLTRPVRRFRLEARAVWVRWVAVRGGVEGAVGPTSHACVRPPRSR